MNNLFREPFDVAVIATLRPDLLRRTLNSFISNLWGEYAADAHFYVNVDKIGCEESEIEDKCREIMVLLHTLFGKNSVTINYKEPHFPTAWLWGIQRTTQRLVFHLEEDWIVNYKHDFGKMFAMFKKYPKLRHLRLNQFVSTIEHTKLWGKYFANWNGDFFDIEEAGIAPVGWCGHPSLNDGYWLRAVASDINPQRNPEKQFHYYPNIVNKWVLGGQYGIFQPQSCGRAIKDIGRVWMKEHGYEKTGGVNCEWFTHWRKV